MKQLMFLMMAVSLLVASAYGRTVSVSSMTRNSQGRPTATLQLTTGDAAVLYVAYGAVDRGSDFDAWDYRRPVAMVAGDTTAYTYVFPQDMDGVCKMARFFLLEDYDLPISKRYDYVRTDGTQYVETTFWPTGSSAVEMRLSLNSVDSSVALYSARVNTSSTDSFTTFYITGSGWRFDYFAVGKPAKPVAVADQAYTLRMDGSGLYLDGTCISACTPVDKAGRRSLILFGAKYGTSPADAEYKASVKLYSMKAWSNSMDAASIALDLVPTEHEGEPCLYNKIDGTYLKSARSGYPLEHGSEVAVVRPAVLSSSQSHVAGVIWYVDCANGNDDNPGTSAALPKQTIRAATTNALSGDIIRVAPGTYGALEGAQTWPVTSEIGSRVVIPAGVTLESTGGAKNTFIVGAASQTPVVTEGWLAGVGPGAVRCVVAGDGATLRGFTLTGGYTHDTEAAIGNDRKASAFATTTTSRTATLEDCIVSNNVAASFTINMAIVRRCRVIGNVAGPSTSVTSSGSAGFGCYWYGSIIASNCGNATVYNALAFENCTVGGGNVYDPDGHVSSVMHWDVDSVERAIVNSAILAGRFSYGSSAKLCCTNCLVIDSSSFNAALRSWAYNTIITNSAAAQVDSEYRPILGQFAGIDRGGSEHSSAALGDKDILGTPRILNGALDIGAVEYDWRPAFAAELGRRFTVTDASPSVTTNTSGGLLVPEGAVAGTVTSAGPYAIAFTLTGGSLAVYVGGVLAGECSGAGKQSVRFIVANAADEIRFVYTPEAGSTAVLSKFSSMRGFSISLR